LLDLSLTPATGKENNEKLFQVEVWEYSANLQCENMIRYTNYSSKATISISATVCLEEHNILVAAFYKCKSYYYKT